MDRFHRNLGIGNMEWGCYRQSGDYWGVVGLEEHCRGCPGEGKGYNAVM